MTPEERIESETLAAEAEALRTNPSFAAAVTELYKASEAELAELNQQLADAVLLNGAISELRGKIIQHRATIEAINGLTTEIANQILRGKARVLRTVA